MLFLQTANVTFRRNLTKFSYFRNSITFVNGGFVVSWLICLFILFGFSGCGDANSSTSYDDTTVTRDVTYKFYDEELNFIDSASSKDVDLKEKANEYGVEKWYEANSNEQFDGIYSSDGDVVKLYAAANVIEVQNKDDLANIASDLSGKYILIDNIELEGEWTPIGDENNPFKGILNADTSDGERYVIKSLNIVAPSSNAVGLFGFIEDAIIKNIGIELANIIGEINVGGIAGRAIFSKITNSYVVGNISGSGYVGGIVGSADINNNISNSYTSVSISAINDVGGIVGYIGDSIVTNSYATGIVNGSVNVGGIAGSISGGIIASAYSANNVSGDDNFGGIVGALFSGDLNATIIIVPSSISDNLKNFTGGLVIGYVVDTASSLIFTNNIAYTIDYISRLLNYDISDKIEAYLTKVLSGVYGKLWEITIDNVIVAHLNTEYVYSKNLKWKFGKDDANPWIIPESGGAPVLYWQVDS
ncbi:MAG: hypothetical protein LBH45_01890 [Campylobacteraceae bacterium]|jgi:hypothetical protein|nr:hypothetical protein [Campylobacteraceae bacterium]